MLKIFVAILAIAVFISLTVWIYFTIANAFFGDDIPPPNDRDLTPLEREIPKDQNAYFVLYQHFPFLNSEIIYNSLEKIELRKDISIAANMEFYQNPYWTDMTKFLEEVTGFMSIEKLIFLESDYFLKMGQYKKAIDALLEFDELLNKRAKSNNTVVLTNRDRINEKVIEIVNSQSLSKGELLRIVDALKNRPNNLDRFINSIKSRYVTQKNLVKLVKEGGGDQEDVIEKKMGKRPFRLKANKTIKIFGDLAREIITLSEESCSSLKETAPLLEEKIFNEYCFDISVKNVLPLYFKENFVGKVILVKNLDTGAKERRLLQRRCELDFNNSAVQIITAMKIYFSEIGELPSSLEDLSEYLGEIPLDVFSDEKITYSKNKKEIRSVGYDGKSETEDDLVFEIDFKEVNDKQRNIKRG